MVKPLVVYRASAGSGKTFTLAVEYIKLLVQNPLAYKQTLAVTFTNKATEEMKMRILSQLYGIWRGLESSKAYQEKICQELEASPEFVSRQAGTALHLLLHNYNYFRVETIDSFFQSVLRNLARELDLTANLRVGLNDVQVEEVAVDQLIDSLKATDQMLQWLLRYIMDNISDDRSWNVISQIKQFGRTIFRDYYKQQSKKLNDVISQKNFFDDYTKELRQIREDASNRIQIISESFFETIKQEGLTVDDFSRKSKGVCSIFLKMQRGQFDESIITQTVADAIGNPSKWYTKTSDRAEFIHALVDCKLDKLLRLAVEEQPRQWLLYKSAELTLRHLSQLRLLSSIEAKVHELNENANRFLLSDTQQLLHELIDGSDSPFIFEKIGTHLEHIMIDEFQDTSTIQWKNFKVLLQEAMSHEGSSNLIVGDVKQSIYRWRNGDWRLLAGIKDEFPHADQLIEEKPLNINYRSERNIIDFNNAFFTHAAMMEGVNAYDDVKQQYPATKAATGMVEVTLLPAEDYQQTTLDAIVNHINTLRNQHVSATEIAILVRTNSIIPTIANYLMQTMPDINVVSDEAFRLDASPAVITIIQAMRLLLNPDDTIARAYLAKFTTGKLNGTLPSDFTDKTSQLQRLPLYELAEQLYVIFHLEKSKGQTAYLCAFYDQLATYINEETSDLPTFLSEWDETICSKPIQSPEVNGIRIISIHKSKGLEFSHVILPFCDWRMEHSDLLWCIPQQSPFNQLPIAPIDYSMKSMNGTIYQKDYEQEHQQVIIDNLNLLYVAFTRASKSLFVMGRRNAGATRSMLIENVLPLVADELSDSILECDVDTKSPLHFIFGQLPANAQDTHYEKKSDNPFLQNATPINVQIEPFEQQVEFRQSNKSKEFATFSGDDEEANATDYIQLGSILHKVFSNIRTIADVEQALKDLELEGILYNNGISHQRLEDMIRKRLSHPHVLQWFSPHWQLFNECTILTPETQERRPDRVMTDGKETIVVDFKFGCEHQEYHDQVHEYMDLLRQMGMPHVTGYLWFVYSNKIIEVK